MTTRRFIVAMALCLTIAGSASTARADDWPNHPIRIITPLAPGASTDLVARAVAEELSQGLKQPVIVESRQGAGGSIAADLVARSTPDGYTLFLGTAATNGIAKFLIKKLNYDPVKDFTALTKAAELPIALVVNKSVPVENVAEFIAYARQNPGKMTFGSSGYGTTHHFAGEFLKLQAGIDITHVPYRGGAPAMVDLLSGQIPALFATLSTVMPHLASGNVKVLGMIEARRSRLHPEIPTIGETVPGYVMPSSWMGFFAPAGLPEPIMARLHAELVRAINAPSVRTLLDQNGFEIATSEKGEFAGEVQKSLERFGKIAAEAGITPQQ